MKSLIKKDPEKAFMKFHGYEDGRNIKKKDMVEFFTAASEMGTEAVVARIEQFPAMANTAIAMVKQFCEVSMAGLKSHDKSSEMTLSILQYQIDFFQNKVDEGLESKEDVTLFVDKLMELSDKVIEVHKSNQHFILKFIRENKEAVILCIAGLVAVLGVNSKLSKPDFIESDDDDYLDKAA